MQPAEKIAQEKILRDLVPLNALSDERFSELAGKIEIVEVKSGRYLFRKGERDNQTVYLLSGRISLLDGFRKIVGDLEAGTDQCRYPLVAQQPRPHSAKAVGKVLVARLDTGLLDVFLTWDQSNPEDAIDIGEEDTSDWMTRILQSDTFLRLPPSKLQSLLRKLESHPLHQGDVVITEGEEGDYFYIIHEGRCAVTRRNPQGGQDQLAELGSGDSFGEEALVSSNRRNASVTMLTDGLLMRLAKQDFVDLLHTQLVRHVSIDEARRMVNGGAVWVDVRTADEYSQGSFEDSVNIPLAGLRGELPELVFNARYILCCDTGRRSDSAGFLLSHKGYDVCVLEGGISSLSDSDLVDETAERQALAAEAPAASGQPDGADSASGPELQQLRDSYAELRGRYEGLQDELAQQREHELRLEDQLEQLRGELGESTGKLGEMFSSIRGHEEEKALLFEQYSALQEEHEEALGSLQTLLEREQARAGELQAEHESLQRENRQLQERVTADAVPDGGESAALETELAAARDRIEALEAEVREAAASHEQVQQAVASAHDYEQRSATLAAELEQARVEIGRLTGLLENSATEDRGREDTIAVLEQELAEARRQLEEAGSRLADETGAAGSLREQNDALQSEAAGLRAALDESRQQIGQLTESGGSAAAEQDTRLVELQQALDARAGEMETLAAARDRLQAELATLQDENSMLRDGQQVADTELEKHQGAWDEERAALAGQLEEAVQNAAALQAELDRASAGAEQYRQEQEQRLSDAGQERAALEQEAALLREQVSGLEDTLQERLEAANSELEAAAQQRERLQAELAEKDNRLEQATLQAGQQEVQQGVLEQELELARQQQGDLQELAGKHEERARQVEQELQDTIRRSHDELRRKNDNEKELQGQIDRLHKKLEQVSAEYRSARSEAQDSLDHLREELHAEREARAEERAQMAARQRELKEQLSAVASEHEVNMTNQSGVIEEAVAAVRAEERSRLQGVLEAQVTTEEQLARLQGELKQAHAELADFQREEKNRRQTDIALMAEQNQQAEAAISQLQVQLKELVHERDDALEQQEELRDKINVLRSEVEAARDQVNHHAQGVTEDPVKLREQLDETRRNVEMAVRLRGEAEAARDRLMEERNRLLVQVENMQAGAIHAPSQARELPVVRPAGETVQSPLPAAPAAARHPVRGRPRWQLPVFGVLAVLVMLVAGWFLRDGQQLPTVDMTAVVGGLLPEIVGTGPAQDSQSAAEDRQSVQMPEAGQAMQQPLGQSAGDAEQQTADSVAAGRVLGDFSDALKIGGRGPEMVRLAAGSFLMGSHGNSINHEEVPRHRVDLGGFSISRHEVTFAEYDRFARATGRRLPADEKWGRGEQPVINVSWQDATAYAKWLSKQTGEHYRLPSEAEWEYAARAGTDGNYWWSEDLATAPANCFNCGSRWDGARTAPVGQFPANGFGLLDMSGNVQEWTADCYHDSYQDAPVDGSAWTSPGCTGRPVRGGSYSSPLKALRNARRGQLEQDTRLDNLGFRVVRDN